MGWDPPELAFHRVLYEPLGTRREVHEWLLVLHPQTCLRKLDFRQASPVFLAELAALPGPASSQKNRCGTAFCWLAARSYPVANDPVINDLAKADDWGSLRRFLSAPPTLPAGFNLPGQLGSAAGLAPEYNKFS